MKAYRRLSYYRYRLWRRLRYGRGRGVHSPLGYWMVCQLLQPRYRYYEEPRGRMEALLYRMVARLAPPQLILGEGVSEAYAEVARLAQKDVQIQLREGGRREEERQWMKQGALLITHSLEEARGYEGLGKGIMLLLAPHETEAKSRAFSRWVEAELQEGLVLDFYEGALIAHVPKVRYLYRSSW